MIIVVNQSSTIETTNIFCYLDVQADGEEISSLAGPFKGFLEYRGCFKTPSPSDFIKERTDSFNNNNECAYFCNEMGSKFAATSGMKCYCLNVKPAGKDLLQECDIRCPDSIISGKLYIYRLTNLITFN